MSNRPEKCVVCDEPFGVIFVDRHGAGACVVCGTPYWLAGFNGDTETRAACHNLFVPSIREYWQRTHCRVMPGWGMLGNLRDATPADVTAWNWWAEQHADEWKAIREKIDAEKPRAEAAADG